MKTRLSLAQLAPQFSNAFSKPAITYDFLTTSIHVFDALLEGIPKGAITEIFGRASSGRTTLLHSVLASATARSQICCAVVDAHNSFDPETAAQAGVDLERLLWVQCNGQPDQALKVADLLLHSGGWGVIVLDLGSVDPAIVRRIPISWWYRFRRAVEPTPTSLVVIEREPFVRACASLAVEMLPGGPRWTGRHPRFRLLHQACFTAKPRKPMRSRTAEFAAAAGGVRA